jgi:hypothetical protein
MGQRGQIAPGRFHDCVPAQKHVPTLLQRPVNLVTGTVRQELHILYARAEKRTAHGSNYRPIAKSVESHSSKSYVRCDLIYSEAESVFIICVSLQISWRSFLRFIR